MRLAIALAAAALLSVGIAAAQVSLPWPGPGIVFSGAGGCTMNGTLDFTNGCNVAYRALGGAS